MQDASLNNTQQVSTDKIMQYLKEFMVVKEDLKQVKDELRQEFKSELGKLRSDFMDYLDRRLLDLKGDLVVILKSEDRKLCALVELLVAKSVITTPEAHSIIKMQPFPQSA